ncbi:MAG: MarR family winged helix-turn-helix transcriptional regulator [Oscillospiraceae bacterium]
MSKQIFNDYSALLFKFYPVLRQTMYKAFDMQPQKITRTQQIILVTLSDMGMSSMTKLARSINTSNEQATRAVSQLVQMGFVKREQNEVNRRVINISLTELSNEYLKNVMDSAADIMSQHYNDFTNEELETLRKAVDLTARLVGENK